MSSFWWFENYWWGFALEALVLLYSFAGLAIVCDEFMVPALETLCVRWGIQEDVAGATFMAFGSAAPEIIINAVQTIKSRIHHTPGLTDDKPHDDVALGIGAIIGSGMIAFMIIPAICAIFSVEALSIKRRPMARDVGFYSVALFATIMFLRDKTIMWWEAAFLIVVYICFVLTVVCGRTVRKKYLKEFKGQELARQDSFVIREKEKRASLQSAPSARTNMATPFLNQSSSQVVNQTPFSPTESDTPFVFWSRNDSVTDVEKESTPTKPQENRSIMVSVKQRTLEYSGVTEVKANHTVGSTPATTIQGSPPVEVGGRVSELEEEPRCTILSILAAPLKIMFTITCPKTEIGARLEVLYPLAFLISFAWIAVFSFVVSEVVEEWVVKTGVNEAFFGLTLIAIGAEIPDTIQSVTVAKRGYGSMAVSNCIGSQIVNMCIGLGFSWLLGILASPTLKPVELTKNGVRNVFNAAVCQGTAVGICLILLFGPVIWSGFKQKKLYLNKAKGCVLLLTYILTLSAFGVVEYLQGAF